MAEDGSSRARPARAGIVGALAVLLSATALLAAGCGGSTQSPQEKWAADVCGAVSDWKTSLTSIATDLSGGISKDVLTRKANEAEKATTDLVDRLKAIGPPQTESGQQAKATIDAFATSATSHVASIKSQLESLTGAGVTGITAGVASIAGDVNAIAEDAQTTLNDLERLDPSGELKTAIENDKTCQSLTSGR